MKFYLAARYGRRNELREYAKQLLAAGHAVTSCWIDREHELVDEAFNAGDEFRRTQIGRQLAQDDIDDINAADCLIAFTESPGAVNGRGRGGRHVEMGYALGVGKRVVIVGWPENVFCCLPEILTYACWYEFFAAMARTMQEDPA